VNLCNVGEFYLNLADCEGSITVGKSVLIGCDMSLGIKGSKGRGKSYRFRCDRDAKGLGVLGESVCIR